MKAPSKRRVLIVGNSRSGTTYVCRMLKEVGLRVGHEYVLEDGTVSCYFFMDTPKYPLSPSTPPKGLIAHVGQRMRDYEFKHVLHLVRDPLKTIGSIWKTMGTEHQKWLEKHGVIPKDLKPKLRKAMHAWYEVNKRCERLTKNRYRLEDMKDQHVWENMLDDLGLPPFSIPKVPKTAKNASRGIFKAKRVTWNDLYDMDPGMCSKIAKMAKRYDYSPPEWAYR